MRYKVHEFHYKGMKGLASEKNINILEQFLNALTGRVVSIIKYSYNREYLIIIEELED
ncbi:MAG: hypothetical protein ACFFC3_14195 [Candidatus Odinarchaeota archaeon]